MTAARKVLVTGGAGFVGRHVVRHLLERGDEVIAVDNVAPHTGGIHPDDGWPLFEPRDFERFTFVLEDCRTWFSRVHDQDFDYAFHLAAMVGGRQMIESRPLAVADDLSIDAAYWQWAEIARPAQTVSFSSSAAYPISLQTEEHHVLLSEDVIAFTGDIGMPDMTYGWAKLTAEYLGRLAFERHGLKSVCYRPFSGYGEDQDDAYPFPSICQRALDHQGAEELTVWGTGRQMRDFIHIDDCVDGVFATMDLIEDGAAINLATGTLTSFIEFAQVAADVLGYQPAVRGLSDQPEGVFARGGDPSKLHSLGYEHSISFRTGIERALDYFAHDSRPGRRDEVSA